MKMNPHLRISILLSFFGLIGSVLLHYQRKIDWQIANIFYRQNHWVVNENEPVARFFFYTGPKWLLIASSVYLLAVLVRAWLLKQPEGWRKHLIMLLCLIFIPLTISTAKDWTHEPCPKELSAFGGHQNSPEMGRCYPGGHASGGYALMGLYWFWEGNLWGAIFGLLVGSIMGVYQMAKGAHFLSDTLTTGFFSWIFCYFAFRGDEAISRRRNRLFF